MSNLEIKKIEENEKRIIMFYRNNSFIYFCLENNKLINVRVEENNIFHIGDIILCKIEKNKADINAYFVDLGNGIKGLLQYEDINDESIKQGQDILVQVTKEAHENKVCTVTTYVELAGNYSIVGFTSKNASKLSISKKISSKRREELLNSNFEKYINDNYSILLRTVSEETANSLIINEIVQLNKQLNLIVEKAKHSPSYSAFYKKSFLNYLINDVEPVIITACDDESYNFLLSNDSFNDNITIEKFYANKSKTLLTPAIVYGLNKKLDNITKEKVYLNSGAYLFINKTPAMIIIDVNSGKSNYSRDKEQAVLKTNLEALTEIVYQIGARNLSGIIIIDFINMKNNDSKTILINECKKIFNTIKPPIKYSDITKLGLLEATREKKYVDIYETIKKLDKNILL